MAAKTVFLFFASLCLVLSFVENAPAGSSSLVSQAMSGMQSVASGLDNVCASAPSMLSGVCGSAQSTLADAMNYLDANGDALLAQARDALSQGAGMIQQAAASL